MDPILGQIILWPAPWIPEGWALCDGSVISVNQNQALYSIIGNTYGGNPGVSFALPDLRNRIPMGTQSMSYVGATAGSATSSATAIGAGAATITLNNLPSHTHSATFSPSGGECHGEYRDSGGAESERGFTDQHAGSNGLVGPR